MGISYSHILYLTTCKYTVSCEKNKIKVNLFLNNVARKNKKGGERRERGEAGRIIQLKRGREKLLLKHQSARFTQSVSEKRMKFSMIFFNYA